MVHVAHAVAVFGALYETCQPHTGGGEIQQTRLMHELLGAGHTHISRAGLAPSETLTFKSNKIQTKR